MGGPAGELPVDAGRDEIIEILGALSGGDSQAVDRLVPLLYDELRALATSFLLHGRNGHTLQPTALVNEAYLKLVRHDEAGFTGKAHFMAVASKAMRQVLVDAERRRGAEKRGGGFERITLDEALATEDDRTCDVLALNDAMEKLSAIDDRKSRIVEMRFFGGLSIEATAELLGVARSTVTQDWRFARAWIVNELRQDGAA